MFHHLFLDHFVQCCVTEYCIHGWFAFLTDHKPSDIIELQIWKLYLYMNESNFDISDCFVNVVLL